jgi:inosine-uridine nucleoside N-ribohydrolase
VANRQRLCGAVLLIFLAAPLALLEAQPKRKVIIDEDARGPATTDLQAVLVLLQSPDVEPLGITVVSGDEWRDEEVAHALRLLELIGRTDVPVVPGAVFPLVRTREWTRRWEQLYGRVSYQGAWNAERYHDPFLVPPLREGNPSLKPAKEDAAHFIVRMLHTHPHEVTLFAGGPLSDLALAVAIDPEAPRLAKELVIMGGSIAPAHGVDGSFPSRREFNFWWDPEAAQIVLHAPWPKITVTTVDISIQTRLTKQMIGDIARAQTPVARYLGQYADEEYMWDELAAEAWLDPGIITKREDLYMDVDISRGAGYGDTLVWAPGGQPGLGERLVSVEVGLDREGFYRLFERLMTVPTPAARVGARRARKSRDASGNLEPFSGRQTPLPAPTSGFSGDSKSGVKSAVFAVRWYRSCGTRHRTRAESRDRAR